VNALRKIHGALVAGGVVIDTQPVSRHPPVETDAGELGTLDMSEWARTIEEVDRLTERTVNAGLFTVVDQRRFSVTDHFDTGAEAVAEVREWAGTHVDPALAERIASAKLPVRVHQQVRLRVLKTSRHDDVRI
jgi:hypothetical protein